MVIEVNEKKLYFNAAKNIETVLARVPETSFSIFLIGAGKGVGGTFRDRVRKLLYKINYGPRFNVFYPEHMFEELMASKEFDLLSLENLLAKSVHAVVIILESPGAIAELGAFANHPEMQNKLIVVVNKKHKKERSFIRLGPLSFLEKTKSSVIFYDFKDKSELKFLELNIKITREVRRIAKENIIDTSVQNPIVCQHFILTYIYIVGSIGDELLSVILKEMSPSAADQALRVIFSSALNILVYQKDIILKQGRYELTINGLSRLRKFFEQISRVELIFDKHRVDFLNHRMRRHF